MDGQRFVYVNFADAPWKDTDLRDVPSRLPSMNYWKGGFRTWFYNTTSINSTTAEPPQSLREDSRIVFTRVSEDEWVFDVDAWLVSYYGPNLYSGDMKDYVKLSFTFTINRKRAM